MHNRFHVVNRGTHIRLQLVGGYDDLTREEAMSLAQLLAQVAMRIPPATPIEGQFTKEVCHD